MPSPSIVAASDSEISKAARSLQEGAVVGFPTETVYGLGALLSSEEGIQRVYALKGRPAYNPLIAHVSEISMLDDIVVVPRDGARRDMFLKLATLWPGPLTLVLPKRPSISERASGGLSSLGVRIPSHATARRLIHAAGGAIVAPSANRSLRISPTTAQHVADEFRDEDLTVIDGGPCEHGLESTIVSLLGDTPSVLRHGSISAEEISSLLEIPSERLVSPISSVVAPGMLKRHYAPQTPLTFLRDFKPNEALSRVGFIGFSPEHAEAYSWHSIDILSEEGSLTEVAAKLFSALRRHDSLGNDLIVVDSCASTGIGRAIMDRLARACATED